MIIPARDVAALLGLCLDSLLAQDTDERLEVVVAVNGSSDLTAATARARRATFAEREHELIVLELDEPGKAAALNAAEQRADGGCRIYLDADTVLAPDAITAVHRALHPAPAAARLVSPRLELVVDGRGGLVASYFAVWNRLPAVRDQVIGGGCYAVNALGRARWGDFPLLVNDDAFVRSLFESGEAGVVDSWFATACPDRAHLLAVLRRWRAGNRQLADAGFRSPGAGAVRNLGHVLRQPSLWRHLPAFAFVDLLSRASARPADSSPAWSR